jgi:16S rRNA (guanine1207-N2)-methyltransferase
LEQRYDVIVTNPPFHASGRADRPDIGRAFIAAAAAALVPAGRLWLVANRHLPYEAELARHFSQVRCVLQHDGFKVVEATGATRDAAMVPAGVTQPEVGVSHRPRRRGA